MDRPKSSLNSMKKDLKNLFDEISDIISDEKGQVSEDEIEQLVGLLRSKVQKLQTPNTKPTIAELENLSEKIETGEVKNFISESNILDDRSTMTTLEVISEKMSNYIIQEKGGIFEKDILEIADQLKKFSSLSIVNRSCSNSSKILQAENSTNYNLCTSAKTNKKLKTTNININSEKHSDSKNKTETSFDLYVNLENEIQKKDLNGEKMQKENSENNSTKYKDQMLVHENPIQEDILQTNRVKSESQLLNNADSTCTYIIEEKTSSMSSLIKDQQKTGNFTKPGRSNWEIEKSKAIFKTTGYMNSVIYVRDDCKSIQDNMIDNSGKISLLFNKVIDVILEKYNIEESDIEEIANILQSQSEEKADKSKKDFVPFTPDIPRWVLRGYLKDVIGSNDFKKPMSYLLNKTAEYIIHDKGQICQSDIIKFCSILTRKIINYTKKKDNGKVLRISQMFQTKNMKSKESKPRTSPAKCHQTQNLRHSLESAKDKKPFPPREMKTAITTSNSVILMKNMDSSQILFAPESVDDAIEQGIRSLEYIKNLSEQLLFDLDEKRETNNENTGRNKLIPLKIYQHNPMSSDFLTCDVIQKSIKNKNFFQPKQNVTHGGSTIHKKPFNDNQQKVKPVSQIMDSANKEKNISLSKNTTGNTKNGQVSKQIQKSKQSNNENNKTEQQMNKNKGPTKEKSTLRSSYPLTRCKTDIKRSSKILSRALGISVESSNHSLTDGALTSNPMNFKSNHTNNCLDTNKYMNLKQENKKSMRILTNHLNSCSDKNEEGNSNGSQKPQVVLKIIKTFSLCKSFPPSLKKKNEVSALSPLGKKQVMKNVKLLKLASNNLNCAKEKYFASKIPIRTLYLTRGASFL